jgi:ribosomal protein S18 acetylase RimI-like enzyme
MEVRVNEDPDPVDVLRVEDRVRDETLAASGLAAEEELVVFAREDGQLIGGCCGSTWGGTCELNSLWVDERYRQQGLGGRLMAVAENEALARGCHQVVLFTYLFQAPGFYERRGYRIVGRVDDYPMGTPALWYHKSLRA